MAEEGKDDTMFPWKDGQVVVSKPKKRRTAILHCLTS
jgi:hypothetical protein